MAGGIRKLLRPWPILSVALVGWTLAVAGVSRWFGYDTDVVDMPIPALTALLVAAGAAYVVLVPSLVSTAEADTHSQRAAFMLMIAAGLAARFVLFASKPILEDDYQRYLWDGAVMASGHNPYVYSPHAVIAGGVAHPLGALAARSGPVLDRIGHGELTTIYPPLAQAAFALAYRIAPFSLNAWRSVVLIFDVATLALIVVLLGTLGRPPLWAAVYWWNPVVIKELFNSGHMDGLLAPFVLTSLLLARKRPLLATAAVGIAFGIKFWPALLLPLIWRPLVSDWRQLAMASLVFVAFSVIALWPQVAAGLDQGAGLVAYAGTWSRNSALYPALETLIGWGVGSAHAPLVARVLIGAALVATAVGLAWQPIGSQGDLVGRATLLVGALFLLIPAQYPWYSVWFAPLLAIHPIRGLLLLPAVLPLYELFFYFAAREMPDAFSGLIVWVIWIPVWIMLALDWRRDRLFKPSYVCTSKELI